MRISIYFWLLEERSEDYDKLYADRAEEVERYIEKTGGRIKRKWTRVLRPFEEDEFVFITKIRYRFEPFRSGVIRFYWRPEGVYIPKVKNTYRGWIFKDFAKLGGIQTFEMISPNLLAGVVW